jgi:hypothetical protein
MFCSRLRIVQHDQHIARGESVALLTRSSLMMLPSRCCTLAVALDFHKAVGNERTIEGRRGNRLRTENGQGWR